MRAMTPESYEDMARAEWRELGFYYSRDDAAKEWHLVGSIEGLSRFCDLLRKYVAHPANSQIGEHDHYGPYSYLEIITWSEPGFDDHAIRGSLGDLARLASTVEAKLADAAPESRIAIRDEFAVDSPYSLVLNLREAGFDPAAEDSSLRP